MNSAQAKAAAHAAFDRIWKTRRMTRDEAYAWMGDLLGVPRDRAHIAYLNVGQCLELVRWSRLLLQTIPKPSRRLA